MELSIIEKNNLLATFIALDKGEFEYLLPKLGWFDERLSKDKASSIFSFHKDLNWLELVTDKIEKLGYVTFLIGDSDMAIFKISGHNTQINSFKFLGTKKKAVYDGCVKFVELYNEG